MGLMTHAEVKEIGDKAILDAAVEPVPEPPIHTCGQRHRQRFAVRSSHNRTTT